MDKVLKMITDSTINELLNQNIIMPSQYYKTFDKHSKNNNMYIYDDEFEKQLSEMIDKEFEKINQYMSQTVDGVDALDTITQDAQNAIINKDAAGLMKANEQVKKLKTQIESLQNEIFKDELTKLYNRKYLFHKLLDEKGSFQKEGYAVLIDINNFRKINQKYGQIIADNVLIYTVNFILKKLSNENIKSTAIRYAGDKFIFLFKKEYAKKINDLFKNIRLDLVNSTVKSKSGHIISISFCFGGITYKPKDNLQTFLLELDDLIQQDRFNLLNNSKK